jgi:hypothetical protein
VVSPDFHPMRVSEEPGLRLSLSAKSTFYLPGSEISCSCLTTSDASGIRIKSVFSSGAHHQNGRVAQSLFLNQTEARASTPEKAGFFLDYALAKRKKVQYAFWTMSQPKEKRYIMLSGLCPSQKETGTFSGLCPSQKEKGMPFGLYSCQRKKVPFLEIAVSRRKRCIFRTMPLPRGESY